jgi:hypothetical protein
MDMESTDEGADGVVWTLRNAHGYRMECVVRFAMGGVQVELFSEGSSLVSRVFPNGDEAMAWAEEMRKEWALGE